MSRKLIKWLLLAGVLLGTVGMVWTRYSEIGRTHGEILRYAELRLAGHSTLEFIALPAIHAMLDSMGEPRRNAQLAPFLVPRLQPNHALGVLSGANAAVSRGEQGAPDENDRNRRIIRVGPKRSITEISLAAKLAKNGDTIEIDAGDYHADVAIWDRDELTIRGVGDSVRLIASGASAEGKAIWVIRRGNVLIEGIQFIGSRVPDRNGAGIRLEGGSLVIRNCLFFGNESGILTVASGEANLEIETSEFAYNGAGDGFSHHLYVGRINSLKVTGSYFHHANAGHLIKSRAAQNTIAYNRLTDESGGRASYEIEFPNGGIARLIGNVVQQSSETNNSVVISYGVEGNLHRRNALYLAHNTLINDHRYGGSFLRVSPGAQEVRSINNILVGKGGFGTHAPQASNGDVRADWSAFAFASRHDYRLNATGQKLALLRTDQPAITEFVPTFEYVHPLKLRKLTTLPAFAGALQEPAP